MQSTQTGVRENITEYTKPPAYNPNYCWICQFDIVLIIIQQDRNVENKLNKTFQKSFHRKSSDICVLNYHCFHHSYCVIFLNVTALIIYQWSNKFEIFPYLTFFQCVFFLFVILYCNFWWYFWIFDRTDYVLFYILKIF